KTEERSVTLEDIKNMEFGKVAEKAPEDPYQLVELMNQMKNKLKERNVSEDIFGEEEFEAETLSDKAQQEIFVDEDDFTDIDQGESDDLLKEKYEKLQDKLMKIFAEREDLPLHKEDLESETETEEGESGPEEGTETGEKGEGNEEFDEQEALKKFAELYDEKKKIEDQKELDESQKAKIEKIRDALQGLLGELKNNTEMSRDEIMEEISKHSEELRAVEGGDLTDEEKSEIEETAHEALKEQREIIDIPPELVTNILTENEINGKLAPIVKEGIKDNNPEGAKQKGVKLIQEMFEDLSEEQKQQLEQVLEEHGLEMEEFINKWKEDLAEDVVEAFYEDYREQVQHKIEDSIGTWDKFKAGWKDMGTKAIGIAGAGYLAGSAAEALGASGAGQWIARATGARTMAGAMKENKRQYEERGEDMMTHGAEKESTGSPAMEQIKEEKRGEMAEEVFEDMIAGTSEESDELIGAVISQKLRDATAAEKIQDIDSLSGGDIELDPKKLRENLEDSSLHAKKERILYEYSQELKEEGFEEEAIKRKYETLAEQLDSMFLERRSLVEAGAERGASQEVLENLQAEFEGEIPEDAEQIDSRAVEIMKDIGIPLAAGGAGLAAAAEGMPGVGGGIAGFEAGYRAGKKWEQSAQKEHIAKKEAKRIQKNAVELLQGAGDGARLEGVVENKTDEEIKQDIADLRGGLVNGIFDKRKLNSEEAGYWKKINNVFDEVIEASDVNTAFLESRVQNLLNSLEKELEERQTAGKEYIEEETEIEVKEGRGKRIEMGVDEFEDYLERLRSADHEDRAKKAKSEFERWKDEGYSEDDAVRKAVASVHQERATEKIDATKDEIKKILDLDEVREALNIEGKILHEDFEEFLTNDEYVEGLSEDQIEELQNLESDWNKWNHIKGYMLSLHQESEVLGTREAEEEVKIEQRKKVTEKYQDMVGGLEDLSEKTVESGNEQVDRIIEETGGWRKIVGTIAGAAAGFLVGTAAARSAQAAEGAAAGKEQAPGSAEQPAGAAGGAEESGVTELEPTHIEGEVPADITIENPGEGTIWDNIEAIGEQNNIDLSDAEIQEAAVDVIEKNAEQGRIDVEVPEWSETVGPGDKLETLHDQMTQTELDQVNYDVEEFRDVLENAKEGQAGGGTGTSPASGATQPSAAAEPTPSSPTGGETPTIEAETPGGGTEAAEGAEAPTEVGTAEGSEATAQASETAGAAEGPPTVEEADVDLSEVEGEEPIDLTDEGGEATAEAGSEATVEAGTEPAEEASEAAGPERAGGEEVAEGGESAPEETPTAEGAEGSEGAEAETGTEATAEAAEASDVETYLNGEVKVSSDSVEIDIDHGNVEFDTSGEGVGFDADLKNLGRNDMADIFLEQDTLPRLPGVQDDALTSQLRGLTIQHEALQQLKEAGLENGELAETLETSVKENLSDLESDFDVDFKDSLEEQYGIRDQV
ncbi:MAG: hypothetical protein ABEJ24_03000, partial [Candidatus Magasanikbacteria bacterium]